jgi:hypothetical protein
VQRITIPKAKNLLAFIHTFIHIFVL